MHSLLDGSNVDCVTSVNPVGVTGIEVDPIHGYAAVTSLYYYKHYKYHTCIQFFKL